MNITNLSTDELMKAVAAMPKGNQLRRDMIRVILERKRGSEIHKAEAEFIIDYNSSEYGEELAKAMLIVEEAIGEAIIDDVAIELIKGKKKASLGEKRTWGGVEYAKTKHGWIKTKESDRKEDKGKDKTHSTDQVVAHAENTSSDQLKKIAEDKKHPHNDAAKRELERRAAEEKEKEKQEEEDAKIDEEFNHNRMMAGYHSAMEDKLSQQVNDMRSSSSYDKDYEGIAKRLEVKKDQHNKLSDKHLDSAKKVHNPKRHGDWKQSIPKSEEALKYGEEALKKKK